MRRGFTLVELLVATGVFVFGFSAALGLFLVGTRARSQADGILRLSLAASSLVEEIRLEAGREPTIGLPTDDGLSNAPYQPIAYQGDGFAEVHSDVSAAAEAASDSLYPYKPQPGIWYRVLNCTDEKGSSADKLATALHVDLLVVWNPLPDDTLTMAELARRQRMTLPAVASTLEKAQLLADFLAKRGFALREHAIIIRRASWER